MRVERFSLFFPPLLARVRRGETEYAIGAIPLGGYVKISGMSPHEELPPEVAPRAYLNQPPWKRIVVIAAGPAMNLLIAFLLGWAIIAFHGVLTNDVVVRQVEAGSPAAGKLQPGRQGALDRRRRGLPAGAQRRRDRRAPEAPAGRHQRPRVPRARRSRAASPPRPAKVVVERDGKQVTLLVTPKYDPVAKRMRIGFAYGANEHVGPVHAAGITAQNLWRITTPDHVLDRAHLLRLEGAQGRLGRRRLLRDHAPVLPVRHHPGAQHPGHHLAVAGRGESLPLPAARRRPYLLGGGREDPRTSDSLPPDRAGHRWSASCSSRSSSSSASPTTSIGCAGRGSTSAELTRRRLLARAGAVAAGVAGAAVLSRLPAPPAAIAAVPRRCVALGPAGCIAPGCPQDLRAAGNRDLLAESGTRWVRLWADWPTLMPAPGSLRRRPRRRPRRPARHRARRRPAHDPHPLSHAGLGGARRGGRAALAGLRRLGHRALRREPRRARALQRAQSAGHRARDRRRHVRHGPAHRERPRQPGRARRPRDLRHPRL